MNHIVIAALIVLVLTGCALGPESPTSAREPNRYVEYHDDRYNFDVTFPASWSRAEEEITILGNPNELLALATFPPREGGGCAPKLALREAGPADAIVFLVEFTATAGMKLPPRPPSFDPLPHPRSDECWGASVATYRFRDSGGRFQVDVWLGESATAQTRDEVIGILDSLRFTSREHEGSFLDRVRTVLKDRGLGRLTPATHRQREEAAPVRELRAKVRRKLAKHHPNARLIDVTLAVFTSTNERLGDYRKLMYVVHTGPFSTGDCLEFYDAKTLHADVGSCFLTDRDL